ncbi:MAG: NAD+ synthase [Dehalococcoidia bacterium]|nr:Glutamine-dependent NAD(+) synthetase [Chloroflexota bacterium]MBT9161740.1 Glutamine-dependent NAD(+) synthetase [Chloroflexota bacterium]
MRRFRIGLAQVNCTVGDLEGNTAKILRYIERAKAMEVELICFPEMAITGYPPEDLLLKPEFIADNLKNLDVIVGHSAGIAVVVGFVDSRDGLYNAAAVAYDRKLCGIYHKTYLPNYGVFDEKRYFRPGTEAPIFVISGVSIGVNICEDIWYPTGPASRQASAGAEVILNISASPYHAGKRDLREQMLGHRASEDAVILAYTNLVGGQDELVFDGGSMVLDGRGEAIARAKQFEEGLLVVDLEIEERHQGPRRGKRRRDSERERGQGPRIIVSREAHTEPKVAIPPRSVEIYDPVGEIYAALVLGTRDYIHKNGFSRVVMGLSGGVDSSLVAAIAVDALGPENVIGVSMPSRYSSEGSKTDAQLLSENLGIEMKVIPIEEAMQGYLNMLAGPFAGTQTGIAEENLQARVRGNILMALSNKFGWLVLTTGNKSEIACGYCTLYGDMAGGFAVIKDVPKTLVYELAGYKNSRAGKEIIPRSVIEKEPSAELRPGQRDVDSLPPYEALDPILKAYVEEDKSLGQIIALGFDRELVERVIALVDRSEHKRRQSPPGVKITPRAFGKDRRFPITNRYRVGVRG